MTASDLDGRYRVYHGGRIGSALSWVGVVVGLVKFAIVFLRIIRDVVAQTPEAIKVLRYPLRNNPDLSREAVWAYVYALGIKLRCNAIT